MRRLAVFLLVSVFFCLLVSFTAFGAERKWPGVDETVVEKYASEHGRTARPGPINLSGDALLFAFLAAGAVGGFAMGYYYRGFMARKGGKGETDAL